MTLSWILSALTIGAGLYAVSAKNAVRVQAGAIVTLALAGALAGASGAPILGGLMVWVLAGAAGMLGLCTVIILNLSREEMGGRRIRVQGLFVMALIAWLASGTLGAMADMPSPASSAPVESKLGQILLEQHSVAVALAGVALLASIIAALITARRKV